MAGLSRLILRISFEITTIFACGRTRLPPDGPPARDPRVGSAWRDAVGPCVSGTWVVL